MPTTSLSFRTANLVVASLFLLTTWGIPLQANARKAEGRTRTSVHQNRPNRPNINTRDVQRNRDINRNINRNSNVNGNRNVNVNVKGDRRYYDNRYYYDDRHHHHHHNVGTAFAVGALTGLVVGSIITAASMPPSCSNVYVGGYPYRQCGNTWLQPQYQGSQVTYVVVNPPR